MGEGLGPDVADGGHVSVRGERDGVREMHIDGLRVDMLNDRLDVVFWGLLADEGHDFFAFVAEGKAWDGIRSGIFSGGQWKLTLVVVLEVRSVLLLLLRDQLLIWGR